MLEIAHLFDQNTDDPGRDIISETHALEGEVREGEM